MLKNILYYGFWISLMVVMFISIKNTDPEITTPDQVKYVDYNGLNIAKSDIEYGTVTMNDKTFGSWENDWLGAKEACKITGGRLPTRQELNKIVEAANNGVIRINVGVLKIYYSSEPISPYRVYGIKLKNDGSAYFESIETSGDYKLTGHYPSTRTGYHVRCVK